VKILLDTHAALWWWGDSGSLGRAAREAIADGANEVWFSAASGYEILQNVRLGRLVLPEELGTGLTEAVRVEGWRMLPLSVADAMVAASLDHPHRDPFDRMLAAQAGSGGFALASADKFFRDLAIDLIW
jgi:PIN domain nuclease of toxin-antitoxin system